jgi:MFS family permease
LTEFINDDWQYFIATIISRFFEGVGDSWVQTAAYSLISLKFPENREKFIGIAETASGIGLMAGPGIAGFLYAYLGYFNAFFIFVILIIVSAIFCLVVIPNSINNSCGTIDNERRSVNSQERYDSAENKDD